MNHDNENDRYPLYIILAVVCFSLGFVVARIPGNG